MTRRAFIIVCCFFIIFDFLRHFVVDVSQPDLVKVIDVGQGDSILVNLEGARILVDGGPDFEADRALNKEFAFGKCHLSAIVLTHPHKDHVAGLNRVLEHCEVDLVLYNNSAYQSREHSYFRSLIAEEVEVRNMRAKDKINVSGVDIYVYWPKYKGNYVEESNVNNESVVMLLDKGDVEILLTGDLENEASVKIDYKEMEKHIENGLDVFKFPHHGSKGSLNVEMLELLKPKICVLSVGKNNSFGHPHPIVLETLSEYGCEVLRTDLDGSIEVLLE